MGNPLTSCKGCVFNLKEDNSQTQIGCSAGRLDIFKLYDIEPVEAYDDEEEFYIIPNEACMYYRPKEWKHSGKNTIEQKRMVKEELEIKVQAIVVADKLSIEPLKLTINSLKNQILKPVHISVIRPMGCFVHPAQVRSVLEESGIPWRIQNIVDHKIKPYKYEDMVLDFVKKAPFYSVFNSGFHVPNNFFSSLNYKINEKLLKFAAVLPDEHGNGWTVPKIVYAYLGGNKGMPLINKILQEKECKTLTIQELLN